MARNSALSIILFVALPSAAFAQSGKVFDDLSMSSDILGGERKYAIYLPPDYDSSERRYPVLYLLHGSGDDQTGWIQFGEVHSIANSAIGSGRATPMVIVMPDADTGRRGYFNSPDGEWRYEDFFFEELIPFIEKTYRVKTEQRYRSVAGLSMGGGGAFMYALHRPEMFSSSAPLSASTGVRTVEETKKMYSRRGQEYTDEEIAAHRKDHNVLNLLDAVPVDEVKSVRWYIDCGDDDFLYEGNSLVHIAMRKKEIPHEFRIRDGGHHWTYWRDALPTVLEFVSGAFHQDAY
jgi:enterochelin esterase-like enzyme